MSHSENIGCRTDTALCCALHRHEKKQASSGFTSEASLRKPTSPCLPTGPEQSSAKPVYIFLSKKNSYLISKYVAKDLSYLLQD